jgi:hypothetical protein
MGHTDPIRIASLGHQHLQITTPAIQRTAALGHFVTALKELVNLLTGQPFAALDTIEVMENNFEYFNLWIAVQKSF